MDMQVYKVRDPSGAMREIQGPAGASDAEVVARAQELFGGHEAKLAAIEAADKKLYDPAAGQGNFENFAAGVGKAVTDTGRGVKQLASYVVPGMDSNAITAEIIEARKRDKSLTDTGAGLAGDVAGNIGMALLPGGVLKGASVAARAIPAAARSAEALSTAGTVAMAPRSIPAALGVGGAQGVIQPAANPQERVLNTLLGAGATAAVPVAGAALRTGKAALEPFYEGGKDQIIGRALTGASGGRANDVIAALQSARELVPGSAPTAGQAAGNAGVASMERAAVATVPEAGVAHAERMGAQNTARVNSLEDIAGTGGQREFYDQARKDAAQKLYHEAYDAGVDITRDATSGQFLPKNVVSGVKGEISVLLKRPAIQDAVNDARRLAANEGVAMKDMAGSIKGLDYVKRALDDKIGATNGNEQRILIDLKNRLLTTLDRLSPKYAEARTTFKEMSKPINQMDVAQEIADKSINKLTGNLQPQAYARALDDSTAARATGFKGATLENTMEPAQLERLQAIKDDVARALMAQNAGRGPGSDTVQKLAYTNLVDQAGVPTFLRHFGPTQAAGNLLSRGADAAYGRANKEIAQKLAIGMLDPKEAARMMESATPSQRAEIISLLASRTLTPLGMSVPALTRASGVGALPLNQEGNGR